ncbi:unnamed protein product [Owenia fusiformis]|uniref:Uncharacterized protein n=1 Tax=Owenia fusiformis TaxID=6347 RepID=A0A8J1TB02_OWEFU|nr:unnamed protein product [Owenia fusiformis]
MNHFFLLFLLLWTTTDAQMTRRLEGYNIDRNQISVAGLSSGAAFAHQMHVIHSATFIGAGIFAGMPYNCAENHDQFDCGLNPENINIQGLIEDTLRFASEGNIDPVSNLRGSKIFLLHGTEDFVVNIGSTRHIQRYYENFGSQVASEYGLQVGHAHPTLNYGWECSEGFTLPPNINNCSYDGAFHIFNSIYDNIVNHNGSVGLNGQFFEFDQSEFKTSEDDSLDDVGYMYVPSGCVERSTACKLHIYFHGCANGRIFLDDEIARNSGFNELAELNNIIVMYPQNEGQLIACWDTNGYEGDGLGWQTKDGIQVQAIKRMVDRVTRIQT